jgi:hypothetical protein
MVELGAGLLALTPKPLRISAKFVIRNGAAEAT